MVSTSSSGGRKALTLVLQLIPVTPDLVIQGTAAGMATPYALYPLGGVEAIPLALALSSLLLGALDGGLRALSDAGLGERVGDASRKVDLARTARGTGECLEHGGLRWRDAAGRSLRVWG